MKLQTNNVANISDSRDARPQGEGVQRSGDESARDLNLESERRRELASGLSLKDFLTRPRDEIKLQLKGEPLELYGAAIACVRSNNGLKVVCNGVSVSNHELDKFNIIKDPFFPREFSTLGEGIVVLEKLVDFVDQLVSKQRHICNENKIDYRPVSLDIGQDGRKDSLVDEIFFQIFGQTYEKEAIGVGELHAQVLYFESLKSEDRERLLSALKKMRELLLYCTLQEGNYTGGVPNAKNLYPSSDDTELSRLKKIGIDLGVVSPDVHNEIIGIAQKYGRKIGKETTENTKRFKDPLPKNYDSVEEARLPSHVFYKWHPDYYRAFHQGFFDNYQGQPVRYYKLPTDGDQPFYADTAADRVREQQEIVSGARDPEQVTDHKSDRELIQRIPESVIDFYEQRSSQPKLPGHDFIVKQLSSLNMQKKRDLLEACKGREPEELHIEALITNHYAFLDFWPEISRSIYSPNFSPSEKQKLFMELRAREFGRGNPQNESFKSNVEFLQGIVDRWMPFHEQRALYEERGDVHPELIKLLQEEGLLN